MPQSTAQTERNLTNVYQLRIYTLRTAEALHDYATVHWPRHIPSLRAFGVTTHGIWTDHATKAHRLIALISYPDDADPGEVTTAYMDSPEFAADMHGFDTSNILNVEELALDPTAASPLS
jgi:hypothetical protein